MLRRLGRWSCSDGFCGAGNVLVGCRLAHSRHVEHLHGVEQTAREPHPEEATALAAKTDLLVAGVAVDEYARVMVENEASKLCEASPWAADKRAAEILRLAPVQAADGVPRKSQARDMAFAKLQLRILAAEEAVQAAKLHSEMPPDKQAIMLVLDGRAQVTDRTGADCAMEDGHGVAARRNAGSGPALCARATMGTCANSLWRRTRSTRFAASTEEPEPDRTVRSNTPCTGSLSKQGATRTWSAMSLSDWVRNNNEVSLVMRCAILDVVSWFPGVLQQLWMDVSVRCPHAERCSESASKPGVAAVAGEAEKTKRYGTAVRSLVFETFGRLGGEGTKLLRDLVATAAANGQCSPHAVGRWRTQLERVLLTAQADTYLRALGYRVAERPAAVPPLLPAE